MKDPARVQISGSEPGRWDAEYIRTVLAGHRARTDDLQAGLRPASVLVPFQERPEGLSLIFTKRTNHLHQHGGQISFPGGGRDPEDASDRDTALRETFEEIGVPPEHVEVWGRLNQGITVTLYSLAPFVGRVPYPYDFRLDAFEVERLIIVPLAHLMDPAHVSSSWREWRGVKYPSWEFEYRGDVIWGATARIVHNLLTLLTTGREPGDGFAV